MKQENKKNKNEILANKNRGILLIIISYRTNEKTSILKNLNIMKEKIAVVLCGGKGTRMGSLTKNLPKPLLKIHGKPIIWYSIKMLTLYGFNKIIFPLGYKGEKIKKYLNKEFSNQKKKFHFIDTGVNSSVSKRIHIIKDVIPENSNFFMINSDTIFSFNIDKMFKEHIKIQIG